MHKIEIAALQKEDDPASIKRRKQLEQDVAVQEKELEALTEEWKKEKDRLETMKSTKERLEMARRDLINAQQRGDFTKAGELMHSIIPKLEAEALDEAEGNAEGQSPNAILLGDAVTSDHVAAVVAKATGIPSSNLLSGEKKKLLHMEDFLQARVVGQEEAVTTISDCIRLSRAGLHSHNRPQGVFMFLGPTGVGKTALTKALCEFLFQKETAMTRVDMSEYMEKFSVSRLVGAPPGYVGYEEGGTLTEAVRRQPYQVVLFDEFEKAHRDVSNLLLQVFDEGRLTDSQGRLIDFRNTVIILTSNLGSDILATLPEGQASSVAQNEVMEVVRSHYAPEFLNRIDDMILFNRLKPEAILKIVDLQLNDVGKLLEEKELSIEVHPEARQWLAQQGYSPMYGARPVRRLIHKFVLNPMANYILEGSVQPGSTLHVTQNPGWNAALPQGSNVPPLLVTSNL